MVSKLVEKYATNHTSSEPSILQRLSTATHLETRSPRMLSGHWQGRFLSLISKMLKPKYILEVGTFTGYSALCLAEGLVSEGILHTIDIDINLKPIVTKYIQQSEHFKKIRLHYGDAEELIPTFDLIFDLVYIDADKKQYPTYYEMVLSKMQSGGIILVDNTLWKGQVADSYLQKNDKITQSIHILNTIIAQDKRVEKVILPIRDGLSVIRKL